MTYYATITLIINSADSVLDAAKQAANALKNESVFFDIETADGRKLDEFQTSDFS